MAKPKFKIANLDEAGLERVKEMEDKMNNIYILALEPRVEVASLSTDEVDKLKELEDELGVVLLAYKSAE